MKKIIVLCDGTWCGRDTGTITNIAILAEMIGIDMTAVTSLATSNQFLPDKDKKTKLSPLHPDYPTLIDKQRNIVARYFDGCGHGGSFLDYLWNGGTGGDIGQECTDVYEFLVQHWDSNDCEVWMFGHSRGSYTVRCVAAMINNCGLIKARDTPERTRSFCDQVYSIYRSPWADDAPNGTRMLKFREEASWKVVKADGKPRSPIKFMGLIDTVGSLGIPDLTTGVGMNYPSFYDQDISTEVEKVYHACAMHDRLWAFEPCRARRAVSDDNAITRTELAIYEKWFPGCHYDVGRQNFRFLRQGQNIVEKSLFAIPQILTKPVNPNPVLADLVLLWMLEAVQKEDSDRIVILDTNEKIDHIKDRLHKPYKKGLGSGDVYSSAWNYTPIGIFGSAIHYAGVGITKGLDTITPTVKVGTALQEWSGIQSVLKFMMATRDRRIPDENAVVVHLTEPNSLLGGRSVTEAANLAGRYLSKTYESWLEYRYAVGIIDRVEFLNRLSHTAN